MEAAHGAQVSAKAFFELFSGIRERVPHDTGQRADLGHPVEATPGETADVIEPNSTWRQ
jgi:hypothetical protein